MEPALHAAMSYSTLVPQLQYDNWTIQTAHITTFLRKLASQQKGHHVVPNAAAEVNTLNKMLHHHPEVLLTSADNAYTPY